MKTRWKLLRNVLKCVTVVCNKKRNCSNDHHSIVYNQNLLKIGMEYISSCTIKISFFVCNGNTYIWIIFISKIIIFPKKKLCAPSDNFYRPYVQNMRNSMLEVTYLFDRGWENSFANKNYMNRFINKKYIYI